MRVAKKVNRPNVGVMFNLCHWLKGGKGENLKPLLDQAMPYLRAVSINGADTPQEILPEPATGSSRSAAGRSTCTSF